MNKVVGVLTAGGDSPGLNAAIRGLTKAAQGVFNMHIIGFRDGFRGLMENRAEPLDRGKTSGLLTVGGTILGTSREKPQAVTVGGKALDMTSAMVDNYRKHNLDVLVCMGGGGTQRSALHLAKQGLNVITLPKTIDNDIPNTDVSFGFDTALSIATEAIDRLHSTAHSHHRIVVVEVMGHRVGWLALGAGVAGGADVILIPEIPYNVERVASAIRFRSREGKSFSIVCVAEGALSDDDGQQLEEARLRKKKTACEIEKKLVSEEISQIKTRVEQGTYTLAKRLEEMTGLESRVTILGHLQRGGTPSARDRLLATQLGTACAELIAQERYGVMVAARGAGYEPIPLGEVVGERKSVPLEHPWIRSARHVGTCLGD